MSIASEITRINNNIAAAYEQCELKEAIMPEVQNSANLAQCISTIKVGLSHFVWQDKLFLFREYSIDSDTVTFDNSTVSGDTIDIG